MNIFNANSHGLCLSRMASGSAFGNSLDALGHGQKVVRAWFYQSQATVGGRRDWSAFDHTLAVAKAHGMRMIAVLADQWGNCDGPGETNSGYKGEGWYRFGYRIRAGTRGLPSTYRDWVRQVVTRYRNDPTILAWSLMNEAEDAEWYGGRCWPTATASLVRFETDMASLVKSIDQNHLLTLGTLGSGQCGARGAQYQTVYAVPGIDLCEYHDYSLPGEPVLGDQWNGLAARLRQCAALDKPLFTGEIGLRATQAGGTLAGRARLLEAKVVAQLQAGAVGVLYWAWRDASAGGSSLTTYFIGPGDPAIAVLNRH